MPVSFVYMEIIAEIFNPQKRRIKCGAGDVGNMSITVIAQYTYVKIGHVIIDAHARLS